MILLQISQALQNLNNTVSTSLANLGESKAIDAIVGIILSKTQTLALLFGVCFYLLMLGFNYLKSGINKFTNPNDNMFIDLNELTRTIGLLFLIACYPIFMGAVAQFVNVSYGMTKLSGSDYKQMITISDSINANYVRATTNPALAKAQDVANICAKTGNKYISQANCDLANDFINDYGNSGTVKVNTNTSNTGFLAGPIKQALIDAAAAIQGSIFLFVVTALKLVIYSITKLWLKILYVTGPLAIAFSILPFFRRQGEIWFGYYLNTCFVFVTFNILDCIFFGILSNQVGIGTNSSIPGAYYNQNITCIYYTILIIAYLSAFRITSYYVDTALPASALPT